MIELPGWVMCSKVEGSTNPDQQIIVLRGTSDEAGLTIQVNGRINKKFIEQIDRDARYKVFLEEMPAEKGRHGTLK
jgi:hypothetical protein